MYTSTDSYDIGIVVDAGPAIGYGHVVRCLRLAGQLGLDHHVAFHPLSEACREFVDGSGFATRNTMEFPPLVITDLRETHGITARIHRQGSRHVSIHDLGLAQCRSDVVIDGAITRLFPYHKDRARELYIGPQYMITRDPVERGQITDTVLVTFGGGATADFAQRIADQLYRMGLTVVATTGFTGSAPMTEEQLARTMSTCRFAISASGTSLYDLLASGIPTIAVAFDRLQLRTADAFHELGAVLSAGLMEKLTPSKVLNHVTELLDNRSLVRRLTQAGQMLVDGKGLSRVVEIARRQIWLTSQPKTYMTC
ncbi:MAG: hypothetical protein HY646_11230 [Acidobacteria bacterium]|nr:hypothetical protein [Acidobacteriota bacterium]